MSVDYGQDILLDAELQPVVAANGQPALTSGAQTVVQDIRLRLYTGRDGLFYDPDWKAHVLDFIKDENTKANRLALCAEVVRRIEEDPRVVPASASCAVAAWDEKGVQLDAAFQLVDDDSVYNLVLTAGGSLADLVVADGSTY